MNEEILRDSEFMRKTLERNQKAKEGEERQFEQQTSDVLKKLMLLVGSCDLKIEAGEEKIDASNNHLPISTYISHGSRVLVQLPPSDKPDDIFNWLTKDSKIYNLYAATHGVKITEDTQKFYKEIKTSILKELFFNVIPKFLGFKKHTKHWGIDLAIGGYGENNYKGDKIEANGSNGHLYIYYEPSTPKKPGAMLIGIEPSSPKDPNHSKFGKADILSVTGGGKWSDLINQKWDGDTPHPLIPSKYNGMYINIDDQKAKDLLNLDLNHYGVNIGNQTPQKSISEINKNETLNIKEQQNISEIVKSQAHKIGNDIIEGDHSLIITESHRNNKEVIGHS